MNKKEFVSYIAEKNGIKKNEAEKALNMILNAMHDATADGEEIKILGYIQTEIRDVKECTRKNPQDRTKEITTPAHKKVVATLGIHFQEVV